MTERKLSFSERYGYTPVRNQLQFENMDDSLKNRIWNLLERSFWREKLYLDLNSNVIYGLNAKEAHFVESFICGFLKKPSHLIPHSEKNAHSLIWQEYQRLQWDKVYSLLEFLNDSIQNDFQQLNYIQFSPFTELVNEILEDEGAAYRFINDNITPITSEPEIKAIESNIEDNHYPGVQAHIKSALEHLSRREKPDYPNSIKESISAVESICQVITGEKDKDLNAILKKLDLHPALRQGYEKLYAYTSNENGIRHANFENEADLKLEDALYFLVSCSAFVNYLKAKFPKDN